MFNTAFFSVDPDLDGRQIDTFHDVFDALSQDPEIRAWLHHPLVWNTSLTWKITDRETTRFSRAGQGLNYLIAVSEVLEADRAGRLAEWVQDAVYEYAERLSGVVGVDPPARSSDLAARPPRT